MNEKTEEPDPQPFLRLEVVLMGLDHHNQLKIPELYGDFGPVTQGLVVYRMSS